MDGDREEAAGRRIRRALLAGYLLLLFALAMGSESRRIGDAGEYVDMAVDLIRFELPSIYAHFWFYSAISAPFVAITQAAGLEAYVAFTIVNFLLIGLAFWIASAVLAWPGLLLVFASPIVWWIDKPHTEVFTFALLTITLMALAHQRRSAIHPGWAIVCLGAAGTQNPPFLLLAPLAFVILVWRDRSLLRDRQFLTLAISGFAIGALHPLYNYFRVGRMIPLSGSTHKGVSNIDEVLAILRDSNLSLTVNAPIFVLGALIAVLLAVARGGVRKLAGADVAFAICAGALFLFSFSQTTNYNHGGTPGMSRYAIWLIPLALPFLGRLFAEQRWRWSEGVLTAIAVGSCLTSLAAFHPGLPERSLTPTRFSLWTWSHYPSLDRPLPEVFVERLRESDGQWWVPTYSPDCGKVLVTGRGPGVPVFPFPCFPAPVPEKCTAIGVLCYANRSGAAYSFAVVPRPSFWAYKFERQSVWSREEERVVGNLLERLRWWDMELCYASPTRIRNGGYGIGSDTPHWCAEDRLLVYLKEPMEGSTVTIRLRRPMLGAFLDATTGEALSMLTPTAPAGDVWTAAVPVDRPSVVLMFTPVP